MQLYTLPLYCPYIWNSVVAADWKIVKAIICTYVYTAYISIYVSMYICMRYVACGIATFNNKTKMYLPCVFVYLS